MRGALGATRARLVYQFVTEVLLLVGFGSLGGVIVAGVVMKFLGQPVPKGMALNMPFLGGVGLNAHTGTFAEVIALMVSLLLAAEIAALISRGS